MSREPYVFDVLVIVLAAQMILLEHIGTSKRLSILCYVSAK